MGSEFWDDKTVFVAGATGFLGGWLVDRLVDTGANVVALVHTDTADSQYFQRSLDSRTTVERGDIADREFVNGLFDRHPVDVFFHTRRGRRCRAGASRTARLLPVCCAEHVADPGFPHPGTARVRERDQFDRQGLRPSNRCRTGRHHRSSRCIPTRR